MKTAVNQYLMDEEGSFTVEASFLVPLLCFLVFAVMITALYLCDQNQAKSFLNRRVTELSRNGDDYCREDMEEDKQKLRSQLFMARVTKFSLTKTKARVKGEVEITMRVRIPLVSSWIGNLWQNSFSLSVDVGDNVEQMRRWDQLE